MRDRNIKIKLICIYFGDLPEWFPMWMRSCMENRDYDFLLITDQNYSNYIPENVEIKKMNWENLKKKFENTIKIPISLTRPYKLCDFKPVFGLVFANELKEYDFWGHCDLDMIWGDLGKFVTTEDLFKYDRVGIYGAFTLYRNNAYCNELYKKKGAAFKWKIVFSRSENFIFDEMPGMNCICMKNNVKWKKNIKIADIDTYLSRYGIDLIVNHEAFSWEEGKAVHYFLNNGKVIAEEVAYIHFSGKKPKLSTDNLNRVVFKENKIIELKKDIKTVDDLIEFSGFKSREDDEKQRQYYRNIKLSKLLKSSVYQKMIRIINQIYIRKFYKKYIRRGI